MAQADEICRSELWNISPFGWAYQLSAIANAQPVATRNERSQAIQRWRGLAAWIDQEAANLADGLRLGYRGYRGAVEAEIK